MKIKIKGYKSICTERQIEINGLTILAGANSSGKSSFMQPILLLKQTLESNYSTDSLVLDGANLKLTDSSQLISKVDSERNKSFIVGIESDSGASYDMMYQLKQRTGFKIESQNIINESFPNGFYVKSRTTSQGIKNQIPKDIAEFPFSIFSSGDFNLELKAEPKKCFLYIEARKKNSENKKGFYFEVNGARYVESFLNGIIHVPGLRGNPERSYRKASADGNFTGSFEQYVASIIKQWIEENKKKPNTKDKYSELVRQLRKLGLAESIEAKHINDTRIEISVSRLCKPHGSDTPKDLVNIADVGFGVSQTLPVLVALLAATKNSVVYIEQPELHLHPNAQYKLAEIVVAAIKRGTKVIIETHSSLFIRGVQIAVARKDISPDKVSLNWFTQNEKTGDTQISSVLLDELGRFGEWPADFDEVTLRVEKEYLDLVEKSIFGDVF